MSKDMTFEEWKRQAIEHLHACERLAGVRRGSWNVIIGDDETMRVHGHETIEFFDDPAGYVDYQIECAQ